MYTILVNDDNTLLTTVKERIMQKSKLVDSLHFLVNPTYKKWNKSKHCKMCDKRIGIR